MGDGNELNINDCSTLPSYSSFKSAIFPKLHPKRPQGTKSFLVIIFTGKAVQRCFNVFMHTIFTTQL